MKFDVIIGNPPYQIDTGGSGRQAKPIYHEFINLAKRMNPKHISFIIPARWYSGGFGLDSFRASMLEDKRIRVLSDFPNARQCFPGVDIAGGVCYFLWDKNYKDDCEVITNDKDKVFKDIRPLNEFSIFVRDSRAIKVLRKVVASEEFIKNGSMFERVSAIKPFDLPTNYPPKKNGTPCWFIRKIGLSYADKKDYTDKFKIINKWKVLTPKAPIAGQTDFTKPIKIYNTNNVIIAKPGEICTESYIVLASFDSEVEAINFREFIFNKTVRFLILLTMISQDVNKKNYKFVPNFQDFSKKIDDNLLVEKWGISQEEWDYIDERIIDVNN